MDCFNRVSFCDASFPSRHLHKLKNKKLLKKADALHKYGSVFFLFKSKYIQYALESCSFSQESELIG